VLGLGLGLGTLTLTLTLTLALTRYTWQEQVEAPQRALKAAAARVFVTGRPPRRQHASKLGPFMRRGAEGSTEAGGDVPLVG